MFRDQPGWIFGGCRKPAIFRDHLIAKAHDGFGLACKRSLSAFLGHSCQPDCCMRAAQRIFQRAVRQMNDTLHDVAFPAIRSRTPPDFLQDFVGLPIIRLVKQPQPVMPCGIHRGGLLTGFVGAERFNVSERLLGMALVDAWQISPSGQRYRFCLNRHSAASVAPEAIALWTSGEPCTAVRCICSLRPRNPPSSSPPPALPGPPWMHCGMTMEWPV